MRSMFVLTSNSTSASARPHSSMTAIIIRKPSVGPAYAHANLYNTGCDTMERVDSQSRSWGTL
jgi:hypothetical protein